MKNTNQHNDRLDFGRAWTRTCAAIRQAAPSPDELDILFDDLCEFSLEDVCEALAYHRRHSRFAPLEADIFEYVNSQDCPDAEWELVLDSINAVGFSVNISCCFENIRTAIAVNRMGGRNIIASRISSSGGEEKCRQEFVRTFSQVTSILGYPAAKKYCPGESKSQRIQMLSQNPAFRDSYVLEPDLLADLEKQNRKISPEIVRIPVQMLQPPEHLIGIVYQMPEDAWTGIKPAALAAVRQGEGECLFRVSETSWAIQLPKGGFVSKTEYKNRITVSFPQIEKTKEEDLGI